MLKIFFLTILTFALLPAIAQVQTQVVGDSVYIHANTGTSELILQNSTDTVNGFLFNRGGGRTEFRRALGKINDSTYLIGVDTLHIASSINSTQSINGWNITGNTGMVAGTNFIGTIDNVELMFKVNNILAGRTGKGSFSNTSFGAQSQPITGTGDFNAAFGSLASANLRSGGKNTDIGYEAGYNNLTGNFNTRVGEGANIWDTSSSYNAVLGTEALNHTSLAKIPGGGFNTALGAFALNKHGIYRANIGLGYNAGSGFTGNNTLFLSDSAYHMYFKLDSSANSAPNLIGKDANGFWHIYQIPAGINGGGTVTNIATGYALLGGPITTNGSIAVDTAALHQKFVGFQDSTVYYPYNSNPKGYLTSLNAWSPAGNAGTTSSNFLGTTDNNPMFFKINNTLAGVLGTSSTNNTALGIATLPSTATGTQNSVFGSVALNKVTTGLGNTAVGYGPLFNVTTGTYNVAMGWSAATYSNGSGNVAIGSGALNSTSAVVHSGNYNTAIGYSALIDNYSNNYNIGIGVNAGRGLSDSATLYISDYTNHMRYKLDSATGTAPSVIGKDANGFWHVYQLPSTGSAGITTIQEDGTNVTSRPTLNFNYGVTATDNSASSSTSIDVNLSSLSNALTTDVSMSSGSTFYDGGTISLAAGTWLITATATIESSNNSVMKITGKIWDGTTVYGAGEGSVGSLGGGAKGYVNISMNSLVTVSSTTSIKASYASTIASCSLKAATADNNTGTSGKTTSITAVRIK